MDEIHNGQEMNKLFRRWPAMLLAVLLAACGGGGGGVSDPLSSDKAITNFSLDGVPGTINETNKSIAVTVPNGTDVTALVATYTTTGEKVTILGTLQTSGTTVNNFSSPVDYKVIAADGSSVNYAVTVSISPLSYQGIITAVPAYSYTADSLAAASAVSAIRQRAGVGLVAQDSYLDQAANNHTNYLVTNSLLTASYLDSTINNEYGAHYEDSSNPAYTGTTPQSRATAAGYTGTSVTEIMSFGVSSGANCVASLEDSVYHLADLLSPFMDIGVSFNAGNGAGSACAIELGVPSTTYGQLPAGSLLVAYPYPGQSSVLPTYYNQAEVPNPATDLTVAGHPVLVSLYTQSMPLLSATDVVIQTFSMSDSSNKSVAARVLANAGVTSTGPNLTIDNKINGAGFIILLPEMPLAPNATYSVTFNATVKGSPVGNAWQFQTGNSN
jgi:uncharacterized protein YkwD